MPALIFTSVGETTDFTATAGDVTDAAESAFLSGFRMRLNVGSPAVTASATKNSILADAGRRMTFLARWSAFPSANRSFLGLQDSSGNYVYVAQLTAAGVLVNAPVGATAATGSTLSTNTIYRISLSYTITNTTTFTFKLYVNNVLDSTANAGTMTRTGTDRLQFIHANTWPVNMTGDYSSIYVDDGADLNPTTQTVRSMHQRRMRRAA